MVEVRDRRACNGDVVDASPMPVSATNAFDDSVRDGGAVKQSKSVFDRDVGTGGLASIDAHIERGGTCGKGGHEYEEGKGTCTEAILAKSEMITTCAA